MKLLFSIKSFIQRGLRGYSDYDASNADYYLALLFSELLNKLIMSDVDAPLDMTKEEWRNVLRKIRNGFDFYVYSEEESITEKDRERANRGVAESFKLLGKYYEYLWY